MARTVGRRNRIPKGLDEERAGLRQLQNLPDYTAVNVEYSVASLQSLEASLVAAEQAESQARALYESAHEQTLAAAWAFHDAYMGAKVQVVAQYGKESLALHAVGLKKRSEHKLPTRNAAPKVE